MDDTTQVATATKIETVSVKVKIEADLGFLPFLRYMRKNQWKNPPFGMRDASRATFDIFLSARLGDDMTADQLATELSQQAFAIADRELRLQYPDSFPNAAKQAVTPEVPDEAYVIASTTVERKVEEF